MTITQAFSTITVKSVNEDERRIVGIASTPTPDRYQDIMAPKGAQYKLPLPFLWQHDPNSPIGTIEKVKVTDEGIEITATVLKSDASMPSQMIARLEEAWASIKNQLVRGLSIGFRGLEYAFLDTGGINFLKWDLMEVSAVTIPANADCTINVIKQYGRKQTSAALGNEDPKKPDPKGTNTMTIAELIVQAQQKRAAKVAERANLVTAAAAKGLGLDASEVEIYDNLSAELAELDASLKRFADVENSQKAMAEPVVPGAKSTDEAAAAAAAASATAAKSAQSRGPAIVLGEPTLEKGVGFARMVKCLAAAGGRRGEALEIGKSKYPDSKKLHHILKAAVEAGTTTDTAWAGSLVEYQDYAGDFIDYLRPQTIVGRFGQGNIPSMFLVPFNVSIPAQLHGGSAQWVGEGKAKPLTKMAFEKVKFGHAKLATISVLTEELIRFSNPSADRLVRDSLAVAVIERMDIDFVNPLKAKTDASPASITNGAFNVASTGDPDRDAELLIQNFTAENQPLSAGVWLMGANTALALSMRKNPLGTKSYPEMSMLGGTYQGLPVIVSQYLGNILTLVNASDIYLADDGEVVIDASREASLEMSDAPTSDAVNPTPVEMVSMFQTNSVAIRAERFINWQRRRQTAVAYVTGVNYSNATPTT